MEKNPLDELVPEQEGASATQPFEESMARANTIHELNMAFGPLLDGKVLLNKKDGRAVEFVKFESEEKKVVVQLRQLGGSNLETADPEHFRLATKKDEMESAENEPDEEKRVKEGDFFSDEWEVIEVVKMSEAKEAA